MMRALVLSLSVAMLLSPVQLAAQGKLKIGVQNMQLAVELCLRNYRSEENLQTVFDNAGFALNQSNDANVLDFVAPGVAGGFRVAGPEGYCYVQSEDVPLGIAEDVGQRLAEQLFPGMVTFGSPEHQVGVPVPPCGGLSIFAPQTLTRVTYSAAGNSGDCINDGTSAIAIQM